MKFISVDDNWFEWDGSTLFITAVRINDTVKYQPTIYIDDLRQTFKGEQYDTPDEAFANIKVKDWPVPEATK